MRDRAILISYCKAPIPLIFYVRRGTRRIVLYIDFCCTKLQLSNRSIRENAMICSIYEITATAAIHHTEVEETAMLVLLCKGDSRAYITCLM